MLDLSALPSPPSKGNSMQSACPFQPEPQVRVFPFGVLYGNKYSVSFYAISCFFKLLIVLLQSIGKNCAQREEQSLLEANTRAPAHVTLCWICCQRHGRWMDAHRTEGKELKSDVKGEMLMKVERNRRERLIWEALCGLWSAAAFWVGLFGLKVPSGMGVGKQC